MRGGPIIRTLMCLLALAAIGGARAFGADGPLVEYQMGTLRAAIEDLTKSFAERYPDGRLYLRRLDAMEKAGRDGDRSVAQKLAQLKREALLANPLLHFERLLVVKRKPAGYDRGKRDFRRDELGFPSNHECNSSLKRTGYDNEIAVLSPVGPDGKLQTLYRPEDGGYVGEVDLHFDADRMLLTRSDAESWKVFEIGIDGSGLRQVSKAPPDVDCFDACYLPNGKIVFGCTASYQAVPCWHGQKCVSNLYVMDADGSNVRQLCFDQDHNFHPCVLPNGQVLYHRWDYTGINHIFMRQLMLMDPDGTGQRAIYGSNSWYPNSLYFPRPIPGAPGKLITILSGYHGVHRMGQLVIVDTGRGWHGKDGLAQRISGRGDPIDPIVRDNLVDNDWPKFLHPFPLSDKYFLVACSPSPKSLWGIYLADVFDNVVLLREEPGYALLEPVPVLRQPEPPVVPDRVDPSRDDAVVYLHDVYAGPGLEGVPRGTVKSLRVLAYNFGFRGLAGPDKIGCGGPWEAMRILGTVPLEKDGSAVFRVPANTPLAVQPLDGEGKAVQLMRSWYTAMPGEKVSCVGCHERPAETGTVVSAVAALRAPREIDPWYGPARGFDFAREVQPVLDRYCVACHNGSKGAPPDLRREELVADYTGRLLSGLGVQRMHPQMARDTGGFVKYTPAYEALLPYLRRVSIEDDVSMLVPGEYHADTSELVQMLRKGHAGVKLDGESWDRLVTWIDLNAPCHGTWGDVYPVPDGAHERRMEFRRRYGGPPDDPETIPQLARPPLADVSAPQLHPSDLQSPIPNLSVPGWPFDADEARRRQAALGATEKTIDLGGGVTMRLVRVPAGVFVMGSADGEPDEQPPARVVIREPFWMGAFEVTNAQYRSFDPSHDPGYYAKRHLRSDDQGRPLDGPDQPAVRVSWQRAMDYCRWLSERTGRRFSLPTEAQWEWACRAGSATPLAWGDTQADYSKWANVGDASFRRGIGKEGRQTTGGLEHLMLEGAWLADDRFDDGAVVTARAGSYRPNAWGLYDMHGNAAEWTRSTYRPYPYRDDDGRNNFARPAGAAKEVRVPLLCTTADTWSLTAWGDTVRPQPQARREGVGSLFGQRILHVAAGLAEKTPDPLCPPPLRVVRDNGPFAVQSVSVTVSARGARKPIACSGEAEGRKAVRGGSFFDRPERCRSAFRLSYPQWQRVFNVGFRVVCEDPPEIAKR